MSDRPTEDAEGSLMVERRLVTSAQLHAEFPDLTVGGLRYLLAQAGIRAIARSPDRGRPKVFAAADGALIRSIWILRRQGLSWEEAVSGGREEQMRQVQPSLFPQDDVAGHRGPNGDARH